MGLARNGAIVNSAFNGSIVNAAFNGAVVHRASAPISTHDLFAGEDIDGPSRFVGFNRGSFDIGNLDPTILPPDNITITGVFDLFHDVTANNFQVGLAGDHTAVKRFESVEIVGLDTVLWDDASFITYSPGLDITLIGWSAGFNMGMVNNTAYTVIFVL